MVKMRWKFSILFLGVLLICTASGQTALKTKWKQLGPKSLPEYGVDSGKWSANGMGWIEAIAISEKKPRFIYAGSNTGGLYRTKNGGKTWKFAFKVERVCGVSSIVIDSKKPKHIWVATGVTTFDNDWGLGVLYSKNGGKSWSKTGLTFEPHQVTPLWCLERSTVNPNLFFACSETDIYRSTDQCKTWKIVYDEENSARVHFRHLSVHNRDINKVLASGDKILISEDGGETWQDRSNFMNYHQWIKSNRDSLPDRYATALNPANNDQILVAYEYAGYDYIQRSNDFGKTWKLVSRYRSFDRLDRNHAEISWHPLDSNVVIVGSVRMYFSDNGGLNFETKTAPVVGAANEQHDDIRGVFVTSNGVVYTGNDGGVGVSYDMGKTWKNISGEGLSVSQFFDIAVDSGRVVGGCQDLSSMLYVDGKWHNTSAIYGDGGNNLIRGKDVYVMQSGTLRKGGFDNKSWSLLSVPFYAERFSYPLMFSPLDSNIILAADHHIWQYDLEQRGWSKITTEIPSILTKIVAMDVHENGTIYFAKDQPTWDASEEGLKKRLYKGEIRKDGAWQWSDITASLDILAWREITSIEINPTNAEEVFVCLYGFDGGEKRFKTYRSINGGKSWENISDGLPDVNCFKILYWKGDLFLATDGGVYFMKEGEQRWQHLRGKMPNVHVTDLEVDTFTNQLVVSTYGSGVWAMDLDQLRRLK